MRLGKCHKLMILFVSINNPIWARLRALQGRFNGRKMKEHLTDDVLHVAPTTLLDFNDLLFLRIKLNLPWNPTEIEARDSLSRGEGLPR